MAFDWQASVQALRRDELPGEYDLPLAVGALLLAAFGLVMVGSASISIAEGEGVGPFGILTKHAVFLCGGGVLALLLMRVPLKVLDDNSRLLLLLCFLMLLAVLVPGLGRRINGATRWLNLGVMGFQVVEAAKLLLVIYLASYMVRFATQLRTSVAGILKPLGVLALVVLLLLLQPDFGSAVLVCAIVVGMIWLGGARARDLGGLALLGMPVMAIAALAEPYRVKRLTSFLDPFADPFRDGFQLSQALIAIGRGEWFGVGLGGSVQKLYYLPEAHNDFILAVIAEELGLAGVVLVLALFTLICTRCFRIGLRAVEQGQAFAGYCAFGVGLWLAVQAGVSIGVNLGVLPTKGLTLPLVSAGGSSVLMTCAALGLVLRVGYEVTRRANELALERVDDAAPGATA
ncbi:MAG: putative lipid II flippase FtsW [Xanthomonadaceae bacterium]|jgi:cell division protein FtsW|nr:putative lipid II flippase FtsW [Xanthomonadaceae bacterium]